MANRIWILPGLVVLGSICAGSLHAASSEQPAEHHVIPLKILSVLLTDKRVETVSGNPATPGAPFVVRIHAEAGYIIMPHTHQVDENIVVLKGSWALGRGARFDRGALESMEVGDYGFAPANMAHFALSKTATIIQLSRCASLSRSGWAVGLICWPVPWPRSSLSCGADL